MAIIPVTYYGALRILELPKESDNEMQLGQTMLTMIGQELAAICEGRPVEGFLEYLSNTWQSKGYNVVDPRNVPDMPQVPVDQQIQ